MKEIEDKLKEKYDKVEVPEYMFDTSRVFKRVEKEKKDSKKIISIAASIIAILLIATALIFTMPNILKEDVNNTRKGDKKYISGNILMSCNELNIDNDVVYNIISIEVIKNEEYQIIENIPYTKVKALVINSYLGGLSGEIELYVPGGIFNIKDIKENVKYDQNDEINKYVDEDYVKVNYYKSIFIPVPEEKKTYITTLIEKNGELFVDINRPYGFKEYDPATNIVKDDMGDEQLDINKYLESINP